jgi:hypothetical protein
MNTEWEFPVFYSGINYQLKAVLEYESAQIMRIRVHGIKSSILLETNYPVTRYRTFKKGVTWKYLEGNMGANAKVARLTMDIFVQLERILKVEYPAFDF